MSGYVYHVHASHQIEAGTVNHFDGIVVRTTKVLSYAEYTSLKMALSPHMKDSPAPDRITVQSLTYLGESE